MDLGLWIAIKKQIYFVILKFKCVITFIVPSILRMIPEIHSKSNFHFPLISRIYLIDQSEYALLFCY